MSNERLKVFSGNANQPLAEEICETLHVALGEAVIGRFSDGEIHQYTPGAWEVLLAVSGLAIALLLIVIVLRALRVLPDRMGDADLDPAHQAT